MVYLKCEVDTRAKLLNLFDLAILIRDFAYDVDKALDEAVISDIDKALDKAVVSDVDKAIIRSIWALLGEEEGK